MDNLTRIVKTEISRQYKSVRQFAFAVNIPPIYHQQCGAQRHRRFLL